MIDDPEKTETFISRLKDVLPINAKITNDLRNSLAARSPETARSNGTPFFHIRDFPGCRKTPFDGFPYTQSIRHSLCGRRGASG
jgi:hypothetical protein